MIGTAAIIAGGALLLVGVERQRRRRREVDAAWSEAARALLLTFHDDGRGVRITGESDGRRIEIVRSWQGFSMGTRVRVATPSRHAGDERRRRLLGERTAELRAQHLSAVLGGLGNDAGVTAEDARLIALLDHIDWQPRRIQTLVNAMIHLAHKLDVDRELATYERLAQEALTAVEPADRLARFGRLRERYPGSPRALEVAEKHLVDADAGIRLAAAKEIGGDLGLAALRALVESPGDPEIRLAALEELITARNYEDYATSLGPALRTGRPALRVIAVRLIARKLDRTLFDDLLAAASPGDDELARACAVAIGEFADVRGERALLALLESPTDRVRIAVAEALRELGTVAAVEPLLRLTTGAGNTPAVRQAAREAVARIQSRLGAVDGGRLSLADANESSGAISLAADTGELSIVADPPKPRP